MQYFDNLRLSFLEKVVDAYQSLESGQSNQVLLTFWGNKGIGKTTLLLKIVRHLTINFAVSPIFIDMNSDSFDEVKVAVDKAIENLDQEKHSVVLFDNIDVLLRTPAGGAEFFEFEHNIILPLIERRDVLIVTSSQIEINQWREDDVQISQSSYHLPAFHREDVLQMFSESGLDAETAYDFTLGQPAAVQWLLENPNYGKEEIAQKAFHYFLEGIPETAIKIAEIISVLPIFNGFVLKEIISQDNKASVEYMDVLEWLKEYIRRGLVYWDVEIGSYRFTDSAVRRLLARYFAYQQSNKFYARHEFAMQYFQAEARSPGYLHMHLPSAIYHYAQILTLQGKSVKEVGKNCMQWIQSNLNAWLSARWDEVLENWKNGLGEQAIRDEIIEMIGKATFDTITSELEAVKRKMEVTQ
jgi:hypothetical protein